jgi:AcrR family transcriptional regulator
MHERARSPEDKARRSEDLLVAAEAIALETGGVRFVTVAAVTERAGLHRTGARRYYASKEELLLELAERGWKQWAESIRGSLDGRSGLAPNDVATVLATTITALPVFCDLLAHVAMTLEGDVDMERARKFKINSFAAHDELVGALAASSNLDIPRVRALVAATIALAGSSWQVSHPTPSLAALYQQVPEWGHAAMDFEPRLRLLLGALADGLANLETVAET